MNLTPILESTAASLDIPDELAEEAVLAYEGVGEWLSEEGSKLQPYSPEIYPQGSFRLGTPIRPLRGDDFDIDLVCRLSLRKEQTTQKDLKNLIGTRLRENTDLAKRLTERRRCWTLKYGNRFHLDVLPSIPDLDGTPTAILLTDRELTRWQFSNPKGYAEWFFARMGPILRELQLRAAEQAGAEVADIPEWRIRTPLQRVVQLLKRHRDVAFVNDPNNCPVSIIVTTLAARAYTQERDLSVALQNVARAIPGQIENRNGVWWIPNPAHPGENFADKWNETPERRTAFLRWVARLQEDVRISSEQPQETALPRVRNAFGTAAGVPALTTAAIPILGATGHVQRPLWPESNTQRCTVKGTVYSKIKGRKLWPLTGRSVQKNAGLRFDASTNARGPYEVKWQVTNTGDEAARAGALRGRFENGEGASGATRWERTQYAGTHWVEAFVIQNGSCVARSGPTYVKIRP
jgi:hypothetical protein